VRRVLCARRKIHQLTNPSDAGTITAPRGNYFMSTYIPPEVPSKAKHATVVTERLLQQIDSYALSPSLVFWAPISGVPTSKTAGSSVAMTRTIFEKHASVDHYRGLVSKFLGRATKKSETQPQKHHAPIKETSPASAKVFIWQKGCSRAGKGVVCR